MAGRELMTRTYKLIMYLTEDRAEASGIWGSRRRVGLDFFLLLKQMAVVSTGTGHGLEERHRGQTACGRWLEV